MFSKRKIVKLTNKIHTIFEIKITLNSNYKKYKSDKVILYGFLFSLGTSCGVSVSIRRCIYSHAGRQTTSLFMSFPSFCIAVYPERG